MQLKELKQKVYTLEQKMYDMNQNIERQIEKSRIQGFMDGKSI